MRRLLDQRPSAPTVINAIALFIVLGGQAIAQSNGGEVQASDLAKGSVTARNLAPGIVGTKKLAKNSVTSKTLGNRAVTGRKIRSGSIHGLSSAGTYQSPTIIADTDPPGPMGMDGFWTSSSGTATCNPDDKLVGGGISIATRIRTGRSCSRAIRPAPTRPHGSGRFPPTPAVRRPAASRSRSSTRSASAEELSAPEDLHGPRP